MYACREQTTLYSFVEWGKGDIKHMVLARLGSEAFNMEMRDLPDME